ncbi:MAG: hypothetical protein F6K26_42280 [Moorea sp. SIO2I5]|nr:hypothetical protein [Moorena sp. SIO2I5]
MIHFIKKRPYVDDVGYLKLIEQVGINAGSQDMSDPDYRVIPSNLAQVQHPDSILVSAPQHIIYLMGTEKSYDEEDFDGIGYMSIVTDFEVS